MWVQSSTLDSIFPAKFPTSAWFLDLCCLIIAELFALSWILLSGGVSLEDIMTENFSNLLLKNILKNKFWQDCKIRKKKDFCINLSFPEMFLITIKKAADQGATCKDSLDIDYTALFVLWKIILLALLLMFVSVLVYF